MYVRNIISVDVYLFYVKQQKHLNGFRCMTSSMVSVDINNVVIHIFYESKQL